MTATRIPIDKARQHIAKLHAANMATPYIAAAAGVHPSTICAIAHGRYDLMKASTAQRILAVKPDRDGNRSVDATGAVRRIQAMIGEGRTQAWIAAQLCWPETHIYRLLSGKRPRITRDSRQLVDDLYRAAEQMPPVRACYAAQSQRRAAEAGWPGRDAWWDDTIDDPTIGPYFAGRAVDDGVDDVLVQRAIDGNPDAVAALNRAERIEATRRLLRRGVPPGGISYRLGVSGKTGARLVAAAAA